MAVPVHLRDEAIIMAYEQGDGVGYYCMRCKIGPLSGPAPTGYPRLAENVRGRYKVMPQFGGKREAENVALLCGPCESSYKEHSPFSHVTFYTKWIETYEEEIVEAQDKDLLDAYDDAEPTGDWVSGGQAGVALPKDAEGEKNIWNRRS